MLLLAILLCPLSLMAQSSMPAQSESNFAGVDLPRPVVGSYGIEIGGRTALSRYLGPVTYSGTQLGIYRSWQKALPFAPEQALMNFEAHAAASSWLLNPAATSSMMSIDASFAWQMLAYWQLPWQLKVAVGGGVDLDAGALALLKNSNNPVSLNLAAAIGAGAQISRVQWIGRVPIVALLQFRTPLAGAFFMPGYGETFYEIYLGNHSDIVHFGWPGNRQKFDLRLRFMLDLGRTAMELGYHLDYQRTHANNLTLHSMSNSFTIGIIPGGLGLKRRAPQVIPF